MQPCSSLSLAASPPGRHLDLLAMGTILRHHARQQLHQLYSQSLEEPGVASLLASGPAIPVCMLGSSSTTSDRLALWILLLMTTHHNPTSIMAIRKILHMQCRPSKHFALSSLYNRLPISPTVICGACN
ncbi:hypothetical protein BDA96_01G275800 [Sorghum bicolor]|uniref:Uncharacterized protein n=1 Tax=Sorghum bicolor TaxID=4558 RepID=A0A921S161_SORBI|nr:hypothetical protein BDA96_01G275800 [Sorghum bicolor]